MSAQPDDVVFDAVPQKWAFVLIPFAIVAYIGFLIFGDEGRAIVAGMPVAAISASTRMCWPLRRRTWFWVTMSLITAAHVAALISIPWSHSFLVDLSGIHLVPIMAADFAAILGLIWLLSRVFGAGRV